MTCEVNIKTNQHAQTGLVHSTCEGNIKTNQPAQNRFGTFHSIRIQNKAWRIDCTVRSGVYICTLAAKVPGFNYW